MSWEEDLRAQLLQQLQGESRTAQPAAPFAPMPMGTSDRTDEGRGALPDLSLAAPGGSGPLPPSPTAEGRSTAPDPSLIDSARGVSPVPIQSAPTTTPMPGVQDWSTGDWTADRVRQYFASRGVTANGNSADYWAQKWQEWGKNDPAYFLSRLSTAEEFGGGGGGGGGSASSLLASLPSVAPPASAIDSAPITNSWTPVEQAPWTPTQAPAWSPFSTAAPSWTPYQAPAPRSAPGPATPESPLPDGVPWSPANPDIRPGTPRGPMPAQPYTPGVTKDPNQNTTQTPGPATPEQGWHGPGGTGGPSGGQATGTDTGLYGDFNQALRDRLQQLMDPNSVSAGSPDLKPAVDAYHLQTQRGLEQVRQQNAEAAYANGEMNTGAYQTQNQRAAENAAMNESSFVGTAVQQQQVQRAQQLQSLLQTGAGMITAKDQQNLQRELAQLDAGLKQQGIDFNYAQLGEQSRQFGATQGFNYAQLGEQSRQFGANQGYNYTQLNQNMDQFLRQLAQQQNQYGGNLGLSYAQLQQAQQLAGGQLGYNYAALQAEMNRQALLAAMGG